jgi:LysM repeat protein
MRVQRFHRFALLLLIFSLSLTIGQAQEQNLLTNPGFENGFRAASGRLNPQVANGWELWVASDSDAPSFQQAPFYIPSTAANTAGIIPRVRTGNNAQVYYSFYETHDAGIYQRVTGITAGTELRFSIYGYVFSNNLDELDLSEDAGDVTLRVGIDPTGGTDPFGDNVVYSEPFITYDTFREYSIIATAESNAVTVFVRTTVGEPVQSTVIYLDDAVLNVTPESQPQASSTVRPTNTNVPTNTAVPSSTATRTVAPVVNTVRPTNTTAPTNTIAPSSTVTSGEATPTREGPVAATNTTAPSNTPQAGVPTATTAAVATSTRVPATPVPGFPGSIIHTVRRGDTVGGIAVRYGSSIEAIIEANELDEDAFILVGQNLVIPIRIVPATETPSPTPLVTATSTQTSTSGGGSTSGEIYIVQRGDTLTSIAIRFNTTVASLVQLNGITNPNSIFIGQRLRLGTGSAPVPPTATAAPVVTATPSSGGVIPTQTSTSPGSGQTYLVQPNDTLYRIAIRFNVSIVTLANINGITNYNYIQIGQVLRIP